MKDVILGLGLTLFGALLGFFVGGYLCLYGGIVQIIHTLQDPTGIKAGQIAFGFVRILLAGTLGGVSALCFIIPGLHIIVRD